MSKEITGFKPGSKSWKNFMKYVYGWGAAVVIIGALFKLQHYPGSGPMLVIGLGTEAAIFFLSAFDPIHEDPDWSLVYPELAEDYDGAPRPAGAQVSSGGGYSSTNALDAMLGEANIDAELIGRLGTGLENLAYTANNMNTLGEVSGATTQFVTSIEGASSRVNELSESYHHASDALTGLSNMNSGGVMYAENLKKMTDNISGLNSVYELQLESSTQAQLATREMADKLDKFNANLDGTLDGSKRYKENLTELTSKMESLNSVYGNMLSAMNVNRS